MKIGVIGSGAMGSVYGALLADAGNELWMFDKWQDHVTAMRAQGLRCEGASGDRTVRVNATTRAADAGPCALAIVATKVMDIEAALADGRAMIGPETPGPRDPERPRQCRARAAGARRGEPAVRHRRRLRRRADGTRPRPPQRHGGDQPRRARGRHHARASRASREVWRRAGFTVNVYDDLWPVVWSKLVANVAFSAICTVTGMRVGQVRANESAWAIARACVEEAVAVAAAKGIRLAYDDPAQWVSDFAGKIPNARPSMYQDLLAGRRSEIDSIHGGVVAEGAKARRADPDLRPDGPAGQGARGEG